VIVVDTTVLVYAVGEDHPLAEPSAALVEAIGDGRVSATTTAEVIQEFVHIRARRRGRPDAVRLGRAYVELLGPLLAVERRALEQGLRLFERLPELGAFDAVLAGATLESGASALASADQAFASVPRLRFVDIGSPTLADLIGSS
jgi:predicted nucleic acid-binding protein